MSLRQHPPNVLALHGNGGGGFRFSLLNPPFLLTTPSLPGFEGDKPLSTLADYVAHLDKLVQELPHPRVILGTGIGGSLILEYLQYHSQEVDAVILHAPVGAHLEKRLFPRLLKLPGMARLIQNLISARLLRPLLQRLFFQEPEQLPTDFLNRFFSNYGRCSAFALMFEWLTPRWWAELRPNDIPAALLWGGRERMLKPEHTQEFLKKLPQASVRIVSDWDHFPMIEQPHEFCAEVELLLKELLP
jgi:pimeloyl-ACP methyl ester carboxylesterase